MRRVSLSEFVLHRWQEIGETHQDFLLERAKLSEKASKYCLPAGRLTWLFFKNSFVFSAGKVLTTHQDEPKRAQDYGGHHRYEGTLGILLKGYWVSGSFCHANRDQIGTGPDHGAVTP